MSTTKPTYTLARQLVSLLTQWDAKQASKKNHNPYALGQYIQAAQTWEEMPLAATDPLAALAKVFTTAPGNDRDFCLKPVRDFAKLLA